MKILSKKTLIMGALLGGIGFSTLAPRQSHAMYLVECGMINTNDDWCTVKYFVIGGSLTISIIGIVLLPVVFLDEKAPLSSTMAQVTEKDLKANGYNTQEIADITNDQAAVFNAIKARGEKQAKEELQSSSDKVATLKTWVPQMSQAYETLLNDYK